MPCRHPDIRKFDRIRCCLACGEAVFEDSPSEITHGTLGSPYQYQRLNYALGQEIRLIELLPGFPADEIRCNIIHVNLDDDPEYEAVSYTWATEDGDDALSQIVYAQGCTTISVTVNCSSALRQLRQKGISRQLWVDAICIDQTFPSERNHQVALMSQIYTKATCVRICIEDLQSHPKRHRSTNAFASTKDLYLEYKPLFTWLENLGKTGPEPFFPNLKYLVSRRYFERVWVIQEVALAKAVHMRVNDTEMLLSVAVLRFIQSRFPAKGVLSWDTSFKVKADLVTCLHAGMSGECTDPKDRIFAVLGLMEPTARSFLPVDYTLKIEQLYAYVMISLIRVYKKLDILRYTNWGSRTELEDFRQFLVECRNGKVDHRRNQFPRNDLGIWSCEVDVRIVPGPSPIARTEQPVAASVIIKVPTATTDTVSTEKLLLPLYLRGHLLDIVTHASHHSHVTHSNIIVGVLELILPYFERGSTESNSIEKITPGRSQIQSAISKVRSREITLRFEIKRNIDAWKQRQERSESLSQQARKSEDFLEETHDYIAGTPNEYTKKGEIDSMIRQLEASRSERLLSGYRSDEYTYEYFERRNQLLQKELRMTEDFLTLIHIDTNLEDLLAFEKVLQLEKYDDRLFTGTGETRVFGTHYSVGFAHENLERGDHIFAIDGVRTPLVLRRCEGSDSAYRVVGECYLWAALDLDYWNPGTKKGVWKRRPYDLGEQTRLIEVRGVVPSQTGLFPFLPPLE